MSPRRKPRSETPGARVEHTTAEAILDAAERRVLKHGMGGLKLTAIANDVGVTHPLILHHFGSKNGLIDAMAKRIAARFVAQALPVITANPTEVAPVPAILRHMAAMISGERIGELVQWGIIERPAIMQPALRQMMAGVLEGAVARRRMFRPEQDEAAARAMMRQVVLGVAMLLWGQALMGPALNDALGFDEGDSAAGRDLIGQLVMQYLATG